MLLAVRDFFLFSVFLSPTQVFITRPGPGPGPGKGGKFVPKTEAGAGPGLYFSQVTGAGAGVGQKHQESPWTGFGTETPVESYTHHARETSFFYFLQIASM